MTCHGNVYLNQELEKSEALYSYKRPLDGLNSKTPYEVLREKVRSNFPRQPPSFLTHNMVLGRPISSARSHQQMLASKTR